MNASPDRIAANRANAQHSTGPRTLEGKAISSQNALKHGWYALVLARSAEGLDDDPDAFATLHSSLEARFTPEDELEERLVERLAVLLHRLDRMSTHALIRLAVDVTPQVVPEDIREGSDEIPAPEDPMEALLRSESVLAAEAKLERSISRLLKDLAFLTRYRTRPQPATEQRTAKGYAAGAEEIQPAPEATTVDSAPVENTPEPIVHQVAAEPGSGEARQTAEPVTPPAAQPHDAWLSPYEIERRRRLLWKPAPNAQPKIGDKPGV